MDVKKLAQNNIDDFNNRSYKTKAREVVDPGVVIIDQPMGQQMKGIDGYIQYSETFLDAMPDLKGQITQQQANGNKVTSTVHAKGTFTGKLQTPQGVLQGTGKPVDLEYRLDQEFNDAGKLVRFTMNYDMQDLMRQLNPG